VRSLRHLDLCIALASAPWLAQAAETVSKPTYDALAAARKSIDGGRPADAIGALTALLAKLKDKPYEQALAMQMLGYAQAGANDLGSAAMSFRQALDSGQLPAADARNLRYNLAQILINRGEDKAGLAYLEDWLKAGKATRDAHALAAVAYQRTGNCKAAVPHLKVLAGAKGKDNDKWAQALIACQAKAGQFDQVAAELEERVRADPEDKETWLQLAAAYQRAGQNDRAIATMEVLQARGMLDASQLVNLARLYATAKVPLKAAELLRRTIAEGSVPRDRANQQLLVDSLVLAQEREQAAALLESMIAEGDDGELQYQLGRIYFDLQRWAEAMGALQKAVQSRAIKDETGANLLLGIAAMQTRQTAIAEHSLRIAAGHDGTREQAEWWLQRLRRQQQPPDAAPAPPPT
jgi:Tfp pilus assembly protein PilF